MHAIPLQIGSLFSRNRFDPRDYERRPLLHRLPRLRNLKEQEQRKLKRNAKLAKVWLLGKLGRGPAQAKKGHTPHDSLEWRELGANEWSWGAEFRGVDTAAVVSNPYDVQGPSSSRKGEQRQRLEYFSGVSWDARSVRSAQSMPAWHYTPYSNDSSLPVHRGAEYGFESVALGESSDPDSGMMKRATRGLRASFSERLLASRHRHTNSEPCVGSVPHLVHRSSTLSEKSSANSSLCEGRCRTQSEACISGPAAPSLREALYASPTLAPLVELPSESSSESSLSLRTPESSPKCRVQYLSPLASHSPLDSHSPLASPASLPNIATRRHVSRPPVIATDYALSPPRRISSLSTIGYSPPERSLQLPPSPSMPLLSTPSEPSSPSSPTSDSFLPPSALTPLPSFPPITIRPLPMALSSPLPLSAHGADVAAQEVDDAVSVYSWEDEIRRGELRESESLQDVRSRTRSGAQKRVHLASPPQWPEEQYCSVYCTSTTSVNKNLSPSSSSSSLDDLGIVSPQRSSVVL